MDFKTIEKVMAVSHFTVVGTPDLLVNDPLVITRMGIVNNILNILKAQTKPITYLVPKTCWLALDESIGVSKYASFY